jgi:hypothetical protein
LKKCQQEQDLPHAKLNIKSGEFCVCIIVQAGWVPYSSRTSQIWYIATYGIEIWGPTLFGKLNSTNFMTTCDTAIVENLNTKLCNHLLGVGKKTTHAAIKGELGRFPLLITIVTNTLRYWMRTCSLSPDGIVKKSYLDNLINSCDTKTSWSDSIFRLLSYFDMEQIWESQGEINGTTYIQSFKKTMESKYAELWLNYINRNDSPNKLRTYSTFKKQFCLENYILSCKLSERRNFTKLRVSAHNLAIETGRFTRPKKTPISKRICLLCDSNIIEDEFHIIMNCSYYSEERTHFVDTIK